MPGMNNGLDPNDPTVVAAFRAALLHQGMFALLVFAVLSVAWVSVRAQPGGPRVWGQDGPRHPLARVRAGLWAYGEPAGRQVLRMGFGVLWLADAVLLAQPGMAAGLPSRSSRRPRPTSPSWVQHLGTRREHVVVSAGRGDLRRGVDPGRDRAVAARRAARLPRPGWPGWPA